MAELMEHTAVSISASVLIVVAVLLIAIAVIFVARRVLSARIGKRWAPAMAVSVRCTPPGYVVASAIAVKLSVGGIPAPGGGGKTLEQHLFGGYEGAVQHFLTLLLMAGISWLAVQIVYVITNAIVDEIEEVHGPDSTPVKRARTQVMLIQRVIIALATVLAVGAMLFTWPEVRALGAGLLASAGIMGIIAGVAAQRAIGNLFSGLQLAFSNAIHVDDVVVVEGEWGQVEELSLSYVVVRIWDGRRLVLPVSYFTEKPFENWTKRDRSITAVVYLRVDWSVPIEELRKHLHEVLVNHPLWDGNSWNLLASDVQRNGLIEVRATMSAANEFDYWTLECDVRERLIDYVREHHPHALPRLRAAVGSGDDG